MDKKETEALLSAVTRFTGVKKKELVAATDEKEFDSLSDLIDCISDVVVDHNTEKHEQLKGQATRRAHSKTERLLKESFPDIAFESNKQDKMFETLSKEIAKGVQNDDTTDKKPLSLSKILERRDVQDYIVSEKDTHSTEKMNKFKNSQLVREHMASKMKELGAVLSEDTARAKRQLETLYREFDSKYSLVLNEDGTAKLLDKEGERPFNESNSTFLTLDEVVKKYSPVDFSDNSTNTDTPPKGNGNNRGNNNNNNNNFGFTSDELKNISFKDFEQARTEDPAKAKFIMKQMEDNENNKS